MKKIIISLMGLLLIIFIFFIVMDKFILPNYVSGEEIPIPNVIGLNKSEAVKLLADSGLVAVEGKLKFDERYKVDEILFQKPASGSIVKKGRRVYLIICGGRPKVGMPDLIGKSERNARFTLTKFDLILAEIRRVSSERKRNTIVSQFPEKDSLVYKGDSVYLKISAGPQVGKVRTPLLLGKSLNEAIKILKRASLKIGKITKKKSLQLPNTIINQIPGEGSFLEIGDSVDVVITTLK